MLKQIKKDALMDINFSGKWVIVETILGSFHERLAGTIDKQRWSADACSQEITLSVRSGMFTAGLDLIDKAYINIDSIPKCKCGKVMIMDKWITIDVDMKDWMTHEEMCPACRNEL